MKLIKLQGKFILVSDEDAKNNELLYNIENNTICRAMGDAEVSHFKIIAGIPELPSIDFSLLSEADCKNIGYIHWSKHWEIVNQQIKEGVNPHAYRLGFKTAQSLNDKQFTLEDMRKAMFEAYKNGIRNPKDGKESFSELSNRVIQSLQQTEWDVEVEVDNRKQVSSENKGFLIDNPSLGKPLITNGKIKVIKIL